MYIPFECVEHFGDGDDVNLKRKELLVVIFTVMALFVLSITTVLNHSFLLGLVLALAVPVAVKAVPAFRGRENPALFVVVTVIGLPINIAAVRTLIGRLSEATDTPLLTQILWGTILYFCATSIENIVIGIAGRLLCPRQVEIEL